MQVWKIDQQLKIWEFETSDINVSSYCNMPLVLCEMIIIYMYIKFINISVDKMAFRQ